MHQALELQNIYLNVNFGTAQFVKLCIFWMLRIQKLNESWNLHLDSQTYCHCHGLRVFRSLRWTLTCIFSGAISNKCLLSLFPTVQTWEAAVANCTLPLAPCSIGSSTLGRAGSVLDLSFLDHFCKNQILPISSARTQGFYLCLLGRG